MVILTRLALAAGPFIYHPMSYRADDVCVHCNVCLFFPWHVYLIHIQGMQLFE